MTWIDIAIGFFGLASVLLAFTGTTIGESGLAFGGDRWTDAQAPLYRRITARGWLSLICLFMTMGLIISKKEMAHQAMLNEATSIENLEKENTGLKERIAKQASDIAVLQMQMSQANKSLSSTTSEIEEHHLKSIEAAFKLSAKSTRESDEAVVRLDARANIPIPSRYQENMSLAGGDRFYVAGFIQNISDRALKSVQLKIGETSFPIFKGEESGFFERTLRLPGNPDILMPAVLLNPLLLDNLTLKIIVYPKDSLQTEDPFKELVLSSPFSKQAKQRYKMTTADVLNMRTEPASAGPLASRLLRGAYVRIVQTQKNWVEVIGVDGKQGWVMDQFLAEIK